MPTAAQVHLKTSVGDREAILVAARSGRWKANRLDMLIIPYRSLQILQYYLITVHLITALLMAASMVKPSF